MAKMKPKTLNLHRFLRMLTLIYMAQGCGVMGEVSFQEAEWFENKIRPVLETECVSCHGAEKQKGELILDSKTGIEKGGRHGSLFNFQAIDESLLLKAITHTHSDPDLWMPKNGAALAPEVVADFQKWIESGAKVPDDVAQSRTSQNSWELAYQQRKSWWSYQPLNHFKVLRASGRHPIDHFIDEKLDHQDLPKAPKATFSERVRRLSYRLNGLPPDEDGVRGEWEQVVDQILSSPRYGETVARYWMDLIRYAESHGSEGDPIIPEAFQYRDYLIRSFNEDLPYDQLVKEHLAGDLLAPRWSLDGNLNEACIGPAHLRMNEYGYQPVDTLDEQVKVVDNLIDVYSKAFLGLTVSCARCHDHKFDPISQKDYFALYGIFDSSRPAQVTVSRVEDLDQTKAELTRLKKEIKRSLVEEWQKFANEDLLREFRLVRELEDRRLELETFVRKYQSSSNPNAIEIEPIKRWTFESNTDPEFEVVGNVLIKDGSLYLDGKGSYLDAGVIDTDLKEKTFEVWAKVRDLKQRGGGLITIETLDGKVFDSLVFGEASPESWVAGSNNFKRSKRFDLPEQRIDEWIHLVVTYHRDGTIQVYRNGETYGKPYRPENGLVTFPRGEARVLIGKRHTGGGRPFFHGELDEVRVYNLGLSAQQITASYQAGPHRFNEKLFLGTLSDTAKQEYLELKARVAKIQAEITSRKKDKVEKWGKFLRSERAQHLTGWREVITKDSVLKARNHLQKLLEERVKFNAANFDVLWDVSDPDLMKSWFWKGDYTDFQHFEAGEFRVHTQGDEILAEILPEGVYSDLLSDKLGALFLSPRFKLAHDELHVNLSGYDGAGARLIIDHYPLNRVSTFPQIRPNDAKIRWAKMDTDYRKGSQVYLEFATNADNAHPGKLKDGKVESRSGFGVTRILGSRKLGVKPLDETQASDFALIHASELAGLNLEQRMGRLIELACKEWNQNRLSPAGRLFLNELISEGLLIHKLGESSHLDAWVNQYRKVEKRVPVPVRAPGVIEADGFDANLMHRGNHKELRDEVPRGFIRVLSGNEKSDLKVVQGSGRYELAMATVSDSNPLFARVMVNRVWSWLFGKGLVASVDNFGRLGEQPTHPELLDYLANYFREHQYSIKKLIRHIVLSDTFQRSVDAKVESYSKDPTNLYYSRADVVRLSAEQIRDGLLYVSGQLDHTMHGPSAPHNAYRKSIYLQEKRNSPQPFLEVFDKPKPASTRGLRDRTNIPAQSLTLLNDPFVIKLAKEWAKNILLDPALKKPEVLIPLAYRKCFNREPSKEEIAMGLEYLTHPLEATLPEYLHALFSLKEFIYLR